MIDAPTESLVNSWTAKTVEIARIRTELNQLWTEWESRNPASNSVVRPMSDEQVYMRPSTLNVIVAVETEADGMRAEELISELPEYSPSRTLIMARKGVPEGSDRFSVRLKVEERQHTRGRPPIRQETVTILAPPGNDEALASITSPLLIADLPDMLFIPYGPVANNELVRSLLELVDSMLVDSVWTREAGATFEMLTDPETRQDCPEISDIVWSRLGTWRQLIAQFFDQPAALPSLEALDEVQIFHAPVSGGGRNGLSAGLLTAGWLATRLGWRAAGELVHGRGCWRATLRAGERGKSREVVLSIAEGSTPFSCFSLEKVRLISGSEAPGTFTVERADEEGITTTSSTSTAPEVSRMVLSGCPDDRFLLSQELRQLREDPIYAQALDFASILWPAGLDS
jgi:glucose-6-phosphate dehydrogenase assembly protein OpcA